MADQDSAVLCGLGQNGGIINNYNGYFDSSGTHQAGSGKQSAILNQAGVLTNTSGGQIFNQFGALLENEQGGVLFNGDSTGAGGITNLGGYLVNDGTPGATGGVAAILNQNPRFRAGMTSPLADIMGVVIAEASSKNDFSFDLSDEQRVAMLRGLVAYRRALLQEKPHLSEIIRNIGRGHELPA